MGGTQQVSARQRGFTLIELIVVTAIIAIVSAVAVPAFREYSASRAAVATANELLADLQLARGEALKRDGGVRLAPSAGGWSTGWRLESHDGSRLLEERQLSQRAALTTPLGGAPIRFDRWGALAAPSGGVSFDICVEIDESTGVRRQVLVSATGRAEVSRGAGSRERCA